MWAPLFLWLSKFYTKGVERACCLFYNSITIMENNLGGDFHTHTIFSHGKGTIEQNVQTAIACNLKSIAITDHGFGQPFAGITPKKFEVMKKEVAELRVKYPEIKILLGVEANIIKKDGTIDLTDAQEKEMDIILAGYHLSATERRLRSLFSLAVPAVFAKVGICSNGQRRRNTKTYLEAIKNRKIDVITHPGYLMPLNLTEIGKACADLGTYLEISSRHTIPDEKGLEELINTDVKFIINSDAHELYQIGNVDYAFNLVKKYHIEDRVVNLGHSEFPLRSKS